MADDGKGQTSGLNLSAKPFVPKGLGSGSTSSPATEASSPGKGLNASAPAWTPGLRTQPQPAQNSAPQYAPGPPTQQYGYQGHPADPRYPAPGMGPGMGRGPQQYPPQSQGQPYPNQPPHPQRQGQGQGPYASPSMNFANAARQANGMGPGPAYPSQMQHQHQYQHQPYPQEQPQQRFAPGATPPQPSGTPPTRPPVATSSPKTVSQAPVQTAPVPSPVPLSPQNPIVVWVLGVRGSGKSTQCHLLAEKYNLHHVAAGDIVRSGRDPMEALKEILENKLNGHNGLVLDRLLVESENEIYYVETLLNSFGMGCNLAIRLNVPPELGLSRALARDAEEKADARPLHESRRLQEQVLINDACSKFFRPSSLLTDIDEGTVEEVSASIYRVVDDILRKPTRPKLTLPKLQLHESFPSPILPDYFTFKTIRLVVQNAVGAGAKVNAFPGSQMRGQMSKKVWEKFFKNWPTYYVTLKADGLRVLLARWKDRLFALPGKFTWFFELPLDFLPPALKAYSEKNADDLYFILDAELIHSKPLDRMVLFVFDCLYLGKQSIKGKPFSSRYSAIKALVSTGDAAATAQQMIQMKQFVPLNKLDTILPSLNAPNLPFEIDGLVFQSNGEYRVPTDPTVCKWKPAHMCTVDFRLCNQRKLSEDEEGQTTWMFDLSVITMLETGREERPYEGAVVILTSEECEKDKLCAGIIIEAVKESYLASAPLPPPTGTAWTAHGSKRHREAATTPEPRRGVPPGCTVWKYLRARRDRPAPNSKEIAEGVDTTPPWPFEEMKKACLATMSIATPL